MLHASRQRCCDIYWRIGAVPEAICEQLQLAPFYEKHIAVAGFFILEATVPDHALREFNTTSNG